MCCSPQILSNDTLFPGDRTRDYRHLVVFTPPDNPAFCHPLESSIIPSETHRLFLMHIFQGVLQDFFVKLMFICSGAK